MPTAPKRYLPERQQPRGNACQRGYDRRWRNATRIFLANNPLCVECPAASECVDHIIPHRGDQVLFWDVDNWQAMCKPCHDAKTARGE